MKNYTLKLVTQELNRSNEELPNFPFIIEYSSDGKKYLVFKSDNKDQVHMVGLDNGEPYLDMFTKNAVLHSINKGVYILRESEITIE